MRNPEARLGEDEPTVHVPKNYSVEMLPSAKAEIIKVLGKIDSLHHQQRQLVEQEQQLYLSRSADEIPKLPPDAWTHAYDFFAKLVGKTGESKENKIIRKKIKAISDTSNKVQSAIEEQMGEVRRRFGYDNVEEVRALAEEEKWQRQVREVQVGLMALSVAVDERKNDPGADPFSLPFAITKTELNAVQRDARHGANRNMHAVTWRETYSNVFRDAAEHDPLMASMVDAWIQTRDPRYLAVIQQTLDRDVRALDGAHAYNKSAAE